MKIGAISDNIMTIIHRFLKIIQLYLKMLNNNLILGLIMMIQKFKLIKRIKLNKINQIEILIYKINQINLMMVDE